MPLVPAYRGLRLEDNDFQASSNYIVIPLFKTKKNKNPRKSVIKCKEMFDFFF